MRLAQYGCARDDRKGQSMIANVRARYANGVLTPLEPLDLEEGAEVTVSLGEAQSPKQGLAAIAELVKELHKSIPADAWDGPAQ